MEDFVVSARKYRPDTFNTVVGQSAITDTLINSIKNNHLAHAYLFCGPRGVGKTTCARIFAKTINCSNKNADFEACEECDSCKAFNDSGSFNIHELDAASNNSVEDIRSLTEQVRIPPQIGKYSVYIIDEVHMLSASAFNAFLKTLEEPPAHAIFILATTEKHKIIPTILSRCQVFDFNRIKIADIVNHLEYVAKKEIIEFEAEALNVIAQKADGGMRDALSVFDQISVFSDNNITYDKVIETLNILDHEYYFRLNDAFLNGNISDSLLIYDEILSKGFDGSFFINGLSSYFRDLLVAKDNITIQLLEVGDKIKENYKEFANKLEVNFIYKALNITNSCDLTYKTSNNKRLHVELALIKLCNINNTSLNEEVKKKTNLEVPKTNTSKPAEKVAEKKFITPKRPTEKPKASTSQAQASVSIKSVLKGETSNSQEKEEEKDYIKREEKYTESEALEVYKSFVDNLEKTETRIYSILNKNKVELKDDNLTFEIPTTSTTQQTAIEEQRLEILDYLKNNLKNDYIKLNIVTRITKTKEENKLYTQRDKYNFLNEKNNNLEKLRIEFNLDFN